MMLAQDSLRDKYTPWLPVLILALLVRLIFVAGVAHEESVAAARTGWELAEVLRSTDWQGLVELRGVYGLRTLMVFAPLSIVYLLAGVSDASSLCWPLLLSLINTVLVIALASRFADRKAGLAAGLLWALLPLDVYWANTLSIYTPVVTLMLAGFWFALKAKQERQTTSTLLAVGCALTLLLIEPFFGIYFLLLILIQWASREQWEKVLWPGIAIGYLLVIVWIGPNVLFDSYLDWLGNPGAALLFVLLLAALVHRLLLEKQTAHFKLSWLALSFLCIGIIDRLGVQLETNAASLLISVPQILLIAPYISKTISRETLRKMLWILTPLLLLVAWLGVQGQAVFIPDYSGFNWFSTSTILPTLEILVGVLFFIIILSPRLLQSKNSRTASSFAFILLAGVLFAQLPAAWQTILPQRQLARAAQSAWASIEAQELALPVEVNDEALVELLAYTSGFSPDVKLRFFEKRNQIQDAYVLVYENSLPEIPETWWHMGMFSLIGERRLSLYRALSADAAEQQLQASQDAVDTAPGAQAYLDLHAALVNAGETCAAYEAWLLAQQPQTTPGTYLIIDPAQDCQFPIVGENLLDWQVDRDALHVGYLVLREGETQESVRVNKRYNFFYDPRVFDLRAEVEPVSVYLYQAEVRSRGDLMVLYWNVNGLENYAEWGSYRDWTQVSVLFVTPASGGVEDLSVNLSPVLFDHFDFVEIRNVQLQKVFWPE